MDRLGGLTQKEDFHCVPNLLTAHVGDSKKILDGPMGRFRPRTYDEELRSSSLHQVDCWTFWRLLCFASGPEDVKHRFVSDRAWKLQFVELI